jgi:hypothetical protein
MGKDKPQEDPQKDERKTKHSTTEKHEAASQGKPPSSSGYQWVY